MLGLVVWDPPFGMKLPGCKWDERCITIQELRAGFKQILSVQMATEYAVLVFCKSEMVAMIKKVMLEVGANPDLHELFWHKKGHNAKGGSRRWVPSVEQCVVGFFGDISKRYWNGGENPAERNNHYEYPNPRRTRNLGNNESVSPCFKCPEYVGELVRVTCAPGKAVLDMCSGGLGVSLGAAMIAGREVYAVDNDTPTWIEAAKAALRWAVADEQARLEDNGGMLEVVDKEEVEEVEEVVDGEEVKDGEVEMTGEEEAKVDGEKEENKENEVEMEEEMKEEAVGMKECSYCDEKVGVAFVGKCSVCDVAICKMCGDGIGQDIFSDEFKCHPCGGEERELTEMD